MCGDSVATSYSLEWRLNLRNPLVVAMQAIRLLTGITPILARKAEELSIIFFIAVLLLYFCDHSDNQTSGINHVLSL